MIDIISKFLNLNNFQAAWEKVAQERILTAKSEVIALLNGVGLEINTEKT